MALFVNNINVVSYCFIANDEINLLKVSDSAGNLPYFYNLKCPSPQSLDQSNKSHPNSTKPHYVVSASVSNDCSYITACDSSNFVHLWKRDENSWNHLSARSLLRKCQKIIFSNSGSEVIIADRSGDVYKFSVADVKGKGKFLLGHISLIIDLCISSDDKYLLTSDRDGKVRVSYYPNCYHIHSYCLGHQEFVSSVQSVKLDREVILTSSGDGTIKLWNFDGTNICGVNLYENDVLCDSLAAYGVNKKSNENGDCVNSLPFLLDEKQIAFAVKNINYSSISKMCAILFYSIRGVAMFNISETKDISFNFIKFIPLESIPFDVFFDVDGNLVVLQKNVDNQYLYFKLQESNFKAVDSKCVSVVENLKKLCGNISDCKDYPEDFETLFKRSYDDKDDSVDTKREQCKKSKKDDVK